MCVGMCVCTAAGMHVCMQACAGLQVCMCVCTRTGLRACLCVCKHVCFSVWVVQRALVMFVETKVCGPASRRWDSVLFCPGGWEPCLSPLCAPPSPSWVTLPAFLSPTGSLILLTIRIYGFPESFPINPSPQSPLIFCPSTGHGTQINGNQPGLLHHLFWNFLLTSQNSGCMFGG